MARPRVGIIGCGAIGSYIAKAIDRKLVDVDLVIVFDVDSKRAEELVKKLNNIKPRVAKSINEIISEDIDIVVEVASQEAVKRYAVDILRSGKNLIVMSTGALLNEDLLKNIIRVAREKNVKIYIPSGAIGGLDALKASSIIGIEELVLTTTKNPKALGLGNVDKPTVIFDGDAEEAVRRFPLNINIAASIALAAGKKPRVRVVADPNVDENIHTIYAKGSFGEITIVMKNRKLDESPRTSLIAALSVIQLLKQLSDEVIILGT
ncbi:MAG: aspartate dehydrogenase [Ignisphaera sp.]